MIYRILIADDHEVVRIGLRSLLNVPGYLIVGEAANGHEIVAMARELHPNLAIMGILMPGLNGLDAAKQIRHELPDTDILIFTTNRSEVAVQRAAELGARGYVLKSDPAQELLLAVEAIRRGRPYFAFGANETIPTGYLKHPLSSERLPVGDLTPLTAREQEILGLLGNGGTNRKVAIALNISVKTVETHRTRIMEKLNLHTISELVHYALRNGYDDVSGACTEN